MNARADAVERLERRLGYAFADRALLERALTHPSVVQGGKVSDNQLLEFLGDRVIGLFAAEKLVDVSPAASEGDLTRQLHALVNGKACAVIGRDIGLGPALRMSGSETRAGARDMPTILGDAVEALMAAIYLDGGLNAARAVFNDLWADSFANRGDAGVRDSKTALQEWAQGLGRPLPIYRIITRGGPDHRPVFTVSVTVDGYEPATGEGPSRREAEKAAAALLLTREGQA